jgi:hypothetical protein
MRDESFHLGHFGQNVLKLFDPNMGPGQEWIDSILAFFNSQAPGLNTTPTPHDEPEILADYDPHNNLAAMCHQRRCIDNNDEDFYLDNVSDGENMMLVNQEEDTH